MIWKSVSAMLVFVASCGVRQRVRAGRMADKTTPFAVHRGDEEWKFGGDDAAKNLGKNQR
jgi:hypothetical protein